MESFLKSFYRIQLVMSLKKRFVKGGPLGLGLDKQDRTIINEGVLGQIFYFQFA